MQAGDGGRRSELNFSHAEAQRRRGNMKNKTKITVRTKSCGFAGVLRKAHYPAEFGGVQDCRASH